MSSCPKKARTSKNFTSQKTMVWKVSAGTMAAEGATVGIIGNFG